MRGAGIPVASPGGFLVGVVVQAFEDLELCAYGMRVCVRWCACVCLVKWLAGKQDKSRSLLTPHFGQKCGQEASLVRMEGIQAWHSSWLNYARCPWRSMRPGCTVVLWRQMSQAIYAIMSQGGSSMANMIQATMPNVAALRQPRSQHPRASVPTVSLRFNGQLLGQDVSLPRDRS